MFKRFSGILLFFFIAISPSIVFAEDKDNDGLQDEWELTYFPSLSYQNGQGDPDKDGLDNLKEQSLGTNPLKKDTDNDGLDDYSEIYGSVKTDPLKMDTDDDFLSDSEELKIGTNPLKSDTDDDGLNDYIELMKGTDPTESDSDHGGIWDGEEVLFDNTDPLNPEDDLLDTDQDGLTNFCEFILGTNPFATDSDGDWLPDGEEDQDHNCIIEPGETDPLKADTDGDGLDDGWEILVYKTDPFNEDTDGDGLSDGAEHELKMTKYDCLDPASVDSDRDGLKDGQETGENSVSNPCLPDSDFDGVYDISELYDKTDPMDKNDHAQDTDGDGFSDNYEKDVTKTEFDSKDTDGDGLSDSEEILELNDWYITDPLDADSDDDGILDGNEVGTNPNAWDTDGDGLSDGTEIGLSSPQISVKHPNDTDLTKFVPDSDPSTKTNPLEPDNDGDGLDDGEEDKNHDGKKDGNETDPMIFDTDGDGMDDGWETKYSTQTECGSAKLGPLKPTDPSDKDLDNDGDGLSNIKEYQLTKIVEGKITKNQTNPCRKDSDDDGVSDYYEVKGNYGVIGQFGFGSDPNNPDTDGDGLKDGEEDANHDGMWQPMNETNPVQKDTDGDNLPDGLEAKKVGSDPKKADTDNDGLDDGTEYNVLGTDPLDPDTDKDGLSDGLEVGKKGDSCPNTKTNPHLADTDGDGISDGMEDANKNGCLDTGETNPADPDTDGDFISDGVELGMSNDADPATKTDPLVKDTDGDGLWDGMEDKNFNGAVDTGETDPNNPDTDGGGVSDGTEVIADGTDPLEPKDDFTADPDNDGLTNGEEKAIGTNPYDKDSDHDFIPDNVEVGADHKNPPDSDSDGIINALDTDSDGDGIPDEIEAGDKDLTTPPVDSDGDSIPDYLDKDSDNDSIPDQVEWSVDADNDGIPDTDADKDGKPNYVDTDSDNAQGSDTEEGTEDSDNDGIPNFVDPVDDNPEKLDSDGDGLTNAVEDNIGTDPYNPDTDGDKLNDKLEVDLHTDPLDADSDDDGLKDGDDGTEDTDGDGLIHALDPDSDDDGIFDGTEKGIVSPVESYSYVSKNNKTYSIKGTDLFRRNFVPDEDPAATTDHTKADTDGDGADDGAEDFDHDGKKDDLESDPADPDDTIVVKDEDNDGLSDMEEFFLGTALPDGDSDDDGIPDGKEHNWRNDTDGDGLLNYLDPDSDNDGIPDGTEEGINKDGITKWTDMRFRNFIPDEDTKTKTFMLVSDSDRDGVRDGAEDFDHNGKVDEGETDPLDPQSFKVMWDGDQDGLSDEEEIALGLNPDDADCDDDGIIDGSEPDFSTDVDHDGLVSALDPDSDNDGLADGTEMGLTEPQTDDTDISIGNFKPDDDPSTTTYMLVKDSDRGGLSDGSEDTNKNGRVDPQETDPDRYNDDFLACKDSDSDDLCDDEEKYAGCNPYDADSDDDGLADGIEHNWNFDTDRDGKINVLDPDSDADLLPDGLEMCIAEPMTDTDLRAGFFTADADPLTCTFMLVTDSDRGGVIDGKEDYNKNGKVDQCETDPNRHDDDGVLPEDPDGDGIPTETEIQIGMNPCSNDSDGDTIPDNVESGVDTDGDGIIDALDLDSDNDTIPDIVEAGDADLNTPPVDTDGDGIPDCRDTDSDNDKISDGDEVNKYHTNPWKADTDGGGADDYLELMVHHSDPFDPSDDFKGWLEEGAEIQGGGGCSAARVTENAAWNLAVLAVIIIILFFTKRRNFLVFLLFFLSASAVKAEYHPDAWHASIEGNYFHLNPDGEGIFSVHQTSVPAHLEWRTSFSFQYIDSPLEVVKEEKVLRELIKKRFEAQASAVLGFFKFTEIGFHAPVTLYQNSEYPGLNLGKTAWYGAGNISLFSKIRFISEKTHQGGLALFVPVYFPTGNSGAYMGYKGYGVHPNIIFTRKIEALLLSVNLGYLYQPRTSVFTIEDGSKYSTGWGLQYAPEDSLFHVGAEIVAMTGTKKSLTKMSEVQAETDAGVKLLVGSFVISAGGGKGLTPGYMTPDFRIFVQIEYRKKPNPDRDNDGILNEKDLCPDEAEDKDGFKDDDGCPDRDNDGDGIPDSSDKCPNAAEDKDGFEDADGCPDEDNDKDGIKDADDKCPLEPEDMDGFEDADGCPDKDNDRDGIPDEKDKCPNEPETVNEFQDDDGCPDEKPAEEKKEELKPEEMAQKKRIEITDKVYFMFRTAKLLPKSKPALDYIVKVMKENPDILILHVAGFADKFGTEQFNKKLSKDRAKAVADYLIKNGIDPSRITSAGYGKTKLIELGSKVQSVNRRVEFIIMKMAGDK